MLSPTGHAETLREYLSPGGEAVSAGFENGDDECFNDKSELPPNASAARLAVLALERMAALVSGCNKGELALLSLHLVSVFPIHTST